MAKKSTRSKAKIKSLIEILLTQYRGEKGWKQFKRDIASHKRDDAVLVKRCVVHPPSGSPRRHFVYLMLSIFVTLVHGINTFLLSDPDPTRGDLQWNTLLGDLGLLFGTYRRVYNFALLVTSWNILCTLTTHWYVIVNRGVPDPWTFVWTRFLQTQDIFNGDRSKILLSRRMMIKLWKFFSVAYKTSQQSATMGAVSLPLFVTYACFWTIPPHGEVIYWLAAIWWTAINSVLLVVGYSWISFSCPCLILGIIHWICQINFVLKRMKLRFRKAKMTETAEHQERILQRAVFVSFARWQRLKSDIFGSGYHWAICFAIGANLLNMFASGMIWFYAACYLGSGNLILKQINYLIAFFVVIGSWTMLSVMSLMEHKSSALPGLLFAYSHAFYLLKLPMSRQSIETHKLINRWLKIYCGHVSPNIPSAEVLRIRLEPLFDVTFDRILWLALEAASYYLLIVATIGIPV